MEVVYAHDVYFTDGSFMKITENDLKEILIADGNGKKFAKISGGVVNLDLVTVIKQIP